MSGPVMESAEAAQKYEILRVVNRGGMGEIALARVKGSKGFEKLVVLKRLRADAERDDHREMFDVEAEVMSRIEHPNIVQVFDQPRIDSVQYLAMAYVRGRNLDQVIRRTRQQGARISPAFTLTVVSEVLRGLAFVHRLKDDQGRALGVVHQDITPSNVLVSFFGEVKLTDFGIAYVTSRDGGRRAGVLKGKPRYVSPEVLAGKRVNNRADIYGVGVVMYELLAGRALFARPSLEETLAAVARNELPDFRVVFPQLGEGLFNILHRSLAKDPAERYRTAEEMHAEVAAEVGRLGGTISPPRIGYLLRQWFTGDPDVPEVDPTLDAAIPEPAAPRAPAGRSGFAAAPNLDQTLSELDRLLGGETSSADLFQLPPEIQRELSSLGDNEPFAALTPIPEIALSGPNGEELLLRGMGVRPLDAPPIVGEPDFTPFASKTPHRSLVPPSSWPSHAAQGARAIGTSGARLSPTPIVGGTPLPVIGRAASATPVGGRIPLSASIAASGFTPQPQLLVAPAGTIPSVPGVIIPNASPFAGTTPYPFAVNGPPALCPSPSSPAPTPADEADDALQRSVSGVARRAQLRASRGEYAVTPRGNTQVPAARVEEPPKPPTAVTSDSIPVEPAVEQASGAAAQTGNVPGRSRAGLVGGVLIGYALGVASAVAYWFAALK